MKLTGSVVRRRQRGEDVELSVVTEFPDAIPLDQIEDAVAEFGQNILHREGEGRLAESIWVSPEKGFRIRRPVWWSTWLVPSDAPTSNRITFELDDR